MKKVKKEWISVLLVLCMVISFPMYKKVVHAQEKSDVVIPKSTHNRRERPV